MELSYTIVFKSCENLIDREYNHERLFACKQNAMHLCACTIDCPYYSEKAKEALTDDEYEY